jgi:hypothetical protein
MMRESPRCAALPLDRRFASGPAAFPLETAMRKRLIPPGGQDRPTPAGEWIDLNRLARVEVTSEKLHDQVMKLRIVVPL